MLGLHALPFLHDRTAVAKEAWARYRIPTRNTRTTGMVSQGSSDATLYLPSTGVIQHIKPDVAICHGAAQDDEEGGHP